MSARWTLVVAGLVAALAARPGGTASFVVDDVGEGSDADVGDGVCATAGTVCTLRAALEQANAIGGEAHTITLPAGTFVQSATLPGVVQDVTITGAGAATSIVQSSGAARPRLFVVPAGGRLALNGLALTNAAVGPGSAIQATGGDVVLATCAISGNVGGAVQGLAAVAPPVPATITASGTTFSGNTGGPALQASDYYVLAVDGCTFADNHRAGNLGGAIAIDGSGSGRMQSITGTTFTANTAGGGGALSATNFSGTLSIAGSTFTSNDATGLAGYGGGAILNFKSGLAITDTAFTTNHAAGSGDNGGAILSPQVPFTCRGCTFAGNATVGTGGAVCASGITILNTTFTTNVAGTSGGAIYVDNPTLPNALALGNATITGNSAAAGGGIRGGSTNVVVKNSIVAGNTSPTGPDCVGTIASQGYNLVGDGSACGWTPSAGDRVGTSGAPIVPALGPLADNGGPTPTMALLPGSPAIDAGNPAGCTDFTTPTPLAADQRGSPRPTDGDGVGGAVCDVGAFEAPDAGATTSTTLAGETTSTTDSSTSTTTTLPAPLCAGGVAVRDPRLVLRRDATAAGGESILVRGSLALPEGTPAFFAPANGGAQLAIEDLGAGGGATLELSHRTTPVPGGRGCAPGDGWKRAQYRNTSGRIDTPACTAGSAGGLRRLRFQDRRARGKGIAFVAVTRHTPAGPPVGPFRVTVVVGASIISSLVGDCGVHDFAPEDCTRRGPTLRCR